jgi:hypothetical protein
MNKESILKQLQEAESQISRLKTLICLGEGNTHNNKENQRLGLECLNKAKILFNDVEDKLIAEYNRISVILDNRKALLIELIGDFEEMGLYDNPTAEMDLRNMNQGKLLTIEGIQKSIEAFKPIPEYTDEDIKAINPKNKPE